MKSDNKGQIFTDKLRTKDDRIRASLSSLNDPGDASAQENSITLAVCKM